MGNLITNNKAGDLDLKLSNGGTSVLLSVLLLSGSDLAETEWEKELVTWLAGRDQNILGLGVVGFDIAEFAWSKADFPAQKAFLLKMIDLALTKHRWDALDYDPPYAQDYLRDFRKLVEAYLAEYVEQKEWDWWLKPEEFAKCPKHLVFMHEEGCTICNDS
jgi:hypothetical protein